MELQDLIKIAKDLSQDYDGRSNPERRSIVKFSEEFANYLASSESDAKFKPLADVKNSDTPTVSADKIKKAKEKILEAYLYFVMESIYRTYNYLSPERSRLFVLLKNKLKVTKERPLSDMQNFIYLSRFYHYIQSETAFAPLFKKLYWGSHEQFVVMTKHCLAGVKKRVDGKIKEVEQRTPVLAALQHNFEELNKKYEQETRGRLFTNKSRLRMGRAIALINQSCEDLYINHINITAPETEQIKKANEYLINLATSTYMGLGTYAKLKITREYSLLSPTRSAMYRLNGDATCRPTATTTDCDEKISSLRALAEHIKRMKNNPDYFLGFERKWNEAGIKEIDKFLTEIDQLILEQEGIKNAPSTAVTVIATGTSYTVQYGIGIAAAKFGMDLILPTVAGTLGGPIGLAIYAGGALLTTVIARLIAGSFLSVVTAGLYSWVLDKIGTAVGNATASVVVSAARGGLRALMNNPNIKKEDRDMIENFIQELLRLPDDLMAQKEKDLIKNLMGIGIEPIPEIAARTDERELMIRSVAL